MEEKIETRADARKVWQAWSHMHSGSGEAGKLKYQIINLEPNKRFTMVWKTMFLRLLLTYAVSPTSRGSEIAFDVTVKGPMGWAVRWFLAPKIQANLRDALRTFARKLEG